MCAFSIIINKSSIECSLTDANPAPNQYDVKHSSLSSLRRPPSCKLGQRLASSKEDRTPGPGPGAYNTRPESAKHSGGTITPRRPAMKGQRVHLITEAIDEIETVHDSTIFRVKNYVKTSLTTCFHITMALDHKPASRLPQAIKCTLLVSVSWQHSAINVLLLLYIPGSSGPAPNAYAIGRGTTAKGQSTGPAASMKSRHTPQRYSGFPSSHLTALQTLS